MKRTAPIAGFDVGILVLNTTHELVSGNVQHALSFNFPVLYEVVSGVSGAVLMSGDPSVETAIIAGARTLERSGVGAIVGACGSFANYQKSVADKVDVPVFLSILLEVPLLLRALPRSRQLGIIFASVNSYSDKVCEQCGITEKDRIVAIGAEEIEAFQPIMSQSGSLNSKALGLGLIDLAKKSLSQYPRIGAWLLQCSDLPPYTTDLQRATELPVFDMVSLIHHVHDAFARTPWTIRTSRFVAEM